MRGRKRRRRRLRQMRRRRLRRVVCVDGERVMHRGPDSADFCRCRTGRPGLRSFVPSSDEPASLLPARVLRPPLCAEPDARAAAEFETSAAPRVRPAPRQRPPEMSQRDRSRRVFRGVDEAFVDCRDHVFTAVLRCRRPVCRIVPASPSFVPCVAFRRAFPPCAPLRHFPSGFFAWSSSVPLRRTDARVSFRRLFLQRRSPGPRLSGL